MKEGDIVAIRYRDITGVDDVSDEELRKEEPKIMVVYGKLFEQGENCVKIIVEEDERNRKEHNSYLILNESIIGSKVLQKGGIKW